jgi:hypothetical protein
MKMSTWGTFSAGSMSCTRRSGRSICVAQEEEGGGGRSTVVSRQGLCVQTRVGVHSGRGGGDTPALCLLPAGGCAGTAAPSWRQLTM